MPKVPLADGSVDLIITQQALEHIRNPEAALAECFRVLRKDGEIYFQVPERLKNFPRFG